ncbi:MAG: hypothetical protein JXA18_00125 [Chitinispirillaceae bacterium]|nr:hypothetical protein [Chitinispirillaceae bacterium]
MKKIVAGILLAGCFVSIYATDARVITMGRHDNFFMDEVSIFKNPANINIYPNMVYGSYGEYRPTASDTGQYAALKRTNRDPANPFFGSIVSYSLKQNSENRNQYPMFSFGAIFNRRDEILDFITPGTQKYCGSGNDIMREPAGKIDLLAGYVLENGAMLGVGSYLAFQSETEESKVQYETSVYKGSAGINWPVAKSTNLEVSVVGGILRALGTDYTGQADVLIANNRWFLKGDARLFSALSMINGDFVPHLSAQRVTLKDEGETTYTDVAGGLGLNVNIDKGFFWAGVEGLYKDYVNVRDTNTTGIGGRVSFGIERSIWWDWFVIRVGGQKILYLTERNSRGITRTLWEENIAADASDNDLVSLGFGLNVENRLRIDFVAAEDLAYTLTNFLSGPQHHLFTRVSATYSF